MGTTTGNGWMETRQQVHVCSRTRSRTTATSSIVVLNAGPRDVIDARRYHHQDVYLDQADLSSCLE